MLKENVADRSWGLKRKIIKSLRDPKVLKDYNSFLLEMEEEFSELIVFLLHRIDPGNPDKEIIKGLALGFFAGNVKELQYNEYQLACYDDLMDSACCYFDVILDFYPGVEFISRTDSSDWVISVPLNYFGIEQSEYKDFRIPVPESQYLDVQNVFYKLSKVKYKEKPLFSEDQIKRLFKVMFYKETLIDKVEVYSIKTTIHRKNLNEIYKVFIEIYSHLKIKEERNITKLTIARSMQFFFEHFNKMSVQSIKNKI